MIDTVESFKVLPDGRMSAKDSALYLGVSYKTLANYRTQGTGPKFVKRGAVFYFKHDLDDWASSGKCRSTAEARLKVSQIAA